MKLYVFNYGKNNNGKSRNQSINIERLLFLTCIGVFILMLFVQAALTSPSVRTFINGTSTLEGIPLETEEYLYAEGEIELKLLSNNSNEDLKILLNGEELTAFSQDSIKLTVKNGDVIEIDASNSYENNIVEIASKSENIATDCLGKKLSVNGKIKQLVKLKVLEK